jgi:hypothetical protein
MEIFHQDIKCLKNLNHDIKYLVKKGRVWHDHHEFFKHPSHSYRKKTKEKIYNYWKKLAKTKTSPYEERIILESLPYSYPELEKSIMLSKKRTFLEWDEMIGYRTCLFSEESDSELVDKWIDSCRGKRDLDYITNFADEDSIMTRWDWAELNEKLRSKMNQLGI